MSGKSADRFVSDMLLMIPIMRKPAYNKGADQLSGSREHKQRLCFRNIIYIYIRHKLLTIPLLPKSEISASSQFLQSGLCQICSEILKTGFVVRQLILSVNLYPDS